MDNSTSGLHLNDDNITHYEEEEVDENDANSSTESDALLGEFRTQENISEAPNENTLLLQHFPEPEPELSKYT